MSPTLLSILLGAPWLATAGISIWLAITKGNLGDEQREGEKTKGKLTQAELDRDSNLSRLQAVEVARADEKQRHAEEVERYHADLEDLQNVLAECECGATADRLNKLLKPSRATGGGGTGGGPVHN